MKRGLILFPKSTLGRGVSAFDWWKSAAAQAGISLDVVFFEDVVLEYGASGALARISGEEYRKPDFVIMRAYNTELSMHFERSGIRVFNSTEAMMLSRDKVLTHQCLSQIGIPSPKTLRVFEKIGYEEVASILRSPFIVKSVQGSCGEGVYLVDDSPAYDDAVAACEGEYLLQEFIAASAGRDVRVWTIGGRAVASVLRSSENSFRSNYSAGGTAASFELTDDIAALAEDASKAVGLDFAGVDILLGERPCVCELNGNAGFRTLSLVGGPDILMIFFEYINKEIYG